MTCSWVSYSRCLQSVIPRSAFLVYWYIGILLLQPNQWNPMAARTVTSFQKPRSRPAHFWYPIIQQADDPQPRLQLGLIRRPTSLQLTGGWVSSSETLSLWRQIDAWVRGDWLRTIDPFPQRPNKPILEENNTKAVLILQYITEILLKIII